MVHFGLSRQRHVVNMGDPRLIDASHSSTPAATSSVHESACRSIKVLIPLLALYTIISLSWSSPLADVLRSVSSDTSIKRRTPKSQVDSAVDSVMEGTTSPPSSSVDDASVPPPATWPASTTAVVLTELTTTTAMATTAETVTETTMTTSNAEPPTTEPPVAEPPTAEPPTTEPPTTEPPSTEPSTTTSTTSTSSEGSTGPTVSLDDDSVRPTSQRRKTFNIPEPACMQGSGRAKTFLMVFMGHSGSTAIMSELKSHPETYITAWEPVDHGEIQENTTDALRYTREFFNAGIEKGKVPGFKIRPRHILNDPEAWASLAREYDTRIIWQYRRNFLKQAVGEYVLRVLEDRSVVAGLKTEEEYKNRCDIGAGCSIVVDDFDAFHSIIRIINFNDYMIANATDAIAGGRDCVHELRYEDYLYHRKGALLDLFDFLGLSHAETAPELYKATQDRLCDVVSNWNDFCAAFYGCKVWRALFEDERNGCTCKFSSSPSKYCVTRK